MRAKIFSFAALLVVFGIFYFFGYLNARDYFLFALCKFYPYEVSKISSKNYREQQIACAAKIKRSDNPPIVFLGDSLISGFDLARYFSKDDLINCGINGDTTAGLLKRTAGFRRPLRKAFVMIGYNDLKFRPNAEILQNYRLLVNGIDAQRIYIFSILPVNAKRKWFNRRIKELNKAIEHMQFGRGVTFIDLYADFVNEENDGIDPELTTDGTHLREKAYRKWHSLIKAIVEK